MSQTRSIVASLEAAFESLSCDSKVGTRETTMSRHIHFMWTTVGKGEISFIVSPYLLTRVAYECKFASLRYRRYNVNRISSRLWHNGMRQLRRSPPRAKNVKEERRRDVGLLRFTPGQIDNTETRTRIFVRTCHFDSCNETGRNL